MLRYVPHLLRIHLKVHAHSERKLIGNQIDNYAPLRSASVSHTPCGFMLHSVRKLFNNQIGYQKNTPSVFWLNKIHRLYITYKFTGNSLKS